MTEAQISLPLIFFGVHKDSFIGNCIYPLFSGAFAKLRKATVRFVICPSVPLYVLMEQLGSDWKDFHENLYLRIFRIYVKKFHYKLTRIMNTLHGGL